MITVNTVTMATDSVHFHNYSKSEIHITIFYHNFNVLKQILAISCICWVKTYMYLDFIGIKEINLCL